MLAHVYLITNKKNLKTYVGKTIDPKKRWERHLKGRGGAKRIRSAIMKHGAEAFEFQIIRSFETEAEAYACETQLIATFALDDHRFGYNICAGGRGPNRRSGFKQTPEWIEKRAARKRDVPHTEAGMTMLPIKSRYDTKLLPWPRKFLFPRYRLIKTCLIPWHR